MHINIPNFTLTNQQPGSPYISPPAHSTWSMEINSQQRQTGPYIHQGTVAWNGKEGEAHTGLLCPTETPQEDRTDRQRSNCEQNERETKLNFEAESTQFLLYYEQMYTVPRGIKQDQHDLTSAAAAAAGWQSTGKQEDPRHSSPICGLV
jgi:hypothetical protein